MIISICPVCRRKMMEKYDLVETPYGKEFSGLCQLCIPPRETMLRQYDAIRKHRTQSYKKNNGAGGPPKKDRRAY